MSAAQRQMLETVLGELREGGKAESRAAQRGTHVSTEEAEAGLRKQGFGASDIEAALSVAAPGGGGVSLSHALDWLCINLPESRLPRAFAAGEACSAAFQTLAFAREPLSMDVQATFPAHPSGDALQGRLQSQSSC